MHWCDFIQYQFTHEQHDVLCDCAAAGYIASLLTLLSIGLMIGSTALTNWWLSFWLEKGDGVRTKSVCLVDILCLIASTSPVYSNPVFPGLWWLVAIRVQNMSRTLTRRANKSHCGCVTSLHIG